MTRKKKLELKRETLQALTKDTLGGIHGGVSPVVISFRVCQYTPRVVPTIPPVVRTVTNAPENDQGATVRYPQLGPR